MGFGNPYGDEWNNDIVSHWAEKLIKEGIQYISLADTIGIADAGPNNRVYILRCPVNFRIQHWGVHLHSTPDTWREK